MLVAFETLMLFVNFTVQISDQVLGLDEELFLGDEHAMVAAHVVEAERKVGGAIVAEQAVLQRIRLCLVARGNRCLIVLGALVGRSW